MTIFACAMVGAARAPRCSFYFSKLATLVAYIVNFTFLGVGIWLLSTAEGTAGNQNWESVADAGAEIFAEVVIIYTLTTVLNIPTVDDDTTRPLLSKKESLQLERSGVLQAPWVQVADFALQGEYHDDMEYVYCADCAAGEDCGDENEIMRSLSVPVAADDVDDHAIRKEITITRMNSQDSSSGYDNDDDASSARPAPTELSMKLSTMINKAPAGWDSPYYVFALGRCDLATLGTTRLRGLMAILSGAAPFLDRYITEGAICSLGNLYFNTGHHSISKALYEMWNMHEISNVRATCTVGIKAINNASMVPFMDEMLNLEALTNTKASRVFFDSLSVRTTPLDAADYKGVMTFLPDACGTTRLMAVISGTCLLKQGKFTDEECIEFIRELEQHILTPQLEMHAILAVALEALRVAVLQCRKAWKPADQQLVWQACNQLNRTSVFKSVRTGSQKALEAANFEYLSISKCFGADAIAKFSEEGFDPATVAEFLQNTLDPQIYAAVKDKIETMGNKEKQKEIEFGLEEAHKHEHDGLSDVDPIKDPAILLYMLMTQTKVKKWFASDIFLQELLNSADRFERFVALVALGRFYNEEGPRRLRVEVIPNIAAVELISDVRDLAVVILDTRFKGCCTSESFRGEKRGRLVKSELQTLKDRISAAGIKTSAM